MTHRIPIVESPPDDPVESAHAAGLRYVSDCSPGIHRRRAGAGFVYLSSTKQLIRDTSTLNRIRSLAIPPAWKDVWICPDPNGHLQATGFDARGRKQYRYHPRWREVRDETKYDRMIAFAQALPSIRQRVERDLSLPGLQRNKVLAAIVRLLDTTFIRVGNDEYAKENHSFGLTTMRNEHANVQGSTIHFQFRGKSGIHHAIDLSEPRLARIVRRCQDLPGYELFAYIDENGQVHDVGSADVNDYLREITGQDFTAKHFRTWHGTVLAAMALKEYQAFTSQRQAKRNVVRAVESVAERLGNTPAVCRKCYVHPIVLDTYLDGSLVNSLKRRISHLNGSDSPLPPEEAAILRLLQDRLSRENKRRPAKVA
jgi:DNA topoisomerase-1